MTTRQVKSEGERDRNLEAVLVEAFDVVGGIALLAHPLGCFGEVE